MPATPSIPATPPERVSRRSGVVVPAVTHRRSELAAALGVGVVLAELLFAQLTLALTIAFWAIGKIGVRGPRWLAVPAAAGTVWALALGIGRAAAGYATGPDRVGAYLASAYGSPGRLLHLSSAFAGASGWLPGQLPVALIVATAQTASLSWLSWQLSRMDGGWRPSVRPRGLPDGDRLAGWSRPGLSGVPSQLGGYGRLGGHGRLSGYGRLGGHGQRLGGHGQRPHLPGPVAAVRGRCTAASIRSGGIVTRDGCCVGLDELTGGRAEISWPEAERGVLITGADRAELTDTGLQLACAAIRRRKTVIAIDLTGSARVSRSIATACAIGQAPLLCYGDPGAGQHGSTGHRARDQDRLEGRVRLPAAAGCYEPFRGDDPATASALAVAMIDWTGVGAQQHRACAGYLAAVFGVINAVPAGLAGGRPPVLDDAIRLLDPAKLRSRAARIPAHLPQASALARLAGDSARVAEVDPAVTSVIGAQLSRLRGSALGQWLRPAMAVGEMPGAAGSGLHDLAIGLGQVVRDRAVALFPLDRGPHGRSAGMIARLAAADALAILAALREMSVRSDSLIWINGCEVLDRRQATGLISLGARTGAAVVLGACSAAAAADLATQAGVVLVRGPVSPALIRCLTGDADLLGESLLSRDPDALALLVRGPRQRLRPFCRAIPAGGAA